MPLARVLIIAGSDPSGGAGIQADIKTVTALGGYAMAAVTALTVQDTLGVYRVEPVAPDLVYEQIVRAVGDIGVDAVKIGLLPNAEAVRAVALTLGTIDAPIVLDPVLVATSGDTLSDAGEALRQHLFPLTALLTPNIPEAEALLNRPIATEADMPAALADLAALGPDAILLKGGHLSGDRVVDMLRDSDGQVHPYDGPRIETAHTHGTGCTLASAVATGLGKGLALAAAVAHARDFVRAAIENAPGFGRGHGPLNHALAGRSLASDPHCGGPQD